MLTNVVVQDFPPDIGGYKPTHRRTYPEVY